MKGLGIIRPLNRPGLIHWNLRLQSAFLRSRDAPVASEGFEHVEKTFLRRLRIAAEIARGLGQAGEIVALGWRKTCSAGMKIGLSRLGESLRMAAVVDAIEVELKDLVLRKVMLDDEPVLDDA